MNTRIVTLALVLTAMVLSAGCKSVHWSKSDTLGLWSKKNKKNKEPEVGIPERMVVAWKDSEYEEQGVPLARGFGGRIYFYNAENEPVQVDGELVVYGFDDSRPTKSEQADYKFVFTKEQLAQRYSVNVLGPSYSVWLPWDQVNGDEKQVSLIPVFKDASGKIVRGDLTVNALQGKKSNSEVAKSDQDQTGQRQLPKGLTKIDLNSDRLGNQTVAGTNNATMQVGYHEATVNTPKIRATTISVPNDTAQRMAKGPVAPAQSQPLTAKVTQQQVSTQGATNQNQITKSESMGLGTMPSNVSAAANSMPSATTVAKEDPDTALQTELPKSSGKSSQFNWSMPPKR